MKATRHSMIREIIEKKDIETQEELAEELGKMGINVTQATVSRDIKELRLLKVQGEKGTYKYATADTAEHGLADRFIRIFSESVISVVHAQNLVVIKTLPGSAHVAGEAVDSLKIPQVVGTISGDNTLLVISGSEEQAKELTNRFEMMMKR